MNVWMVVTAGVLLIGILIVLRRNGVFGTPTTPTARDRALAALVSTFSTLVLWGYSPALDHIGRKYGIEGLSSMRDVHVVSASVLFGNVADLMDDLEQLYRAAIVAQRQIHP